MKLLDLYTSVPPEQVVDAFHKAYPHDDLELDFYKNVFLTLVVTRGAVEKDRMISIDHYVTLHDDPVDDEDGYSASLLVPYTLSEFLDDKDSGYYVPSDFTIVDGVDYKKYAMDFTAWDELLGCEVQCLSDVPLSLAEQVAHIFYEMTWHGMESRAQEQHDILKDRVDDFEKSMDAHKTAVENGSVEEGSLPEGFKVFDINDFNLSPESLAKIEQRRNNTKTMRSFRNGIQTWPKPDGTST